MLDNPKKACLIYVTATAGRVAKARAKLEEEGYAVCDAEAISASALPQPVIDCVSQADLCVFLLPEDENDDESLADAAGTAAARDKPIIGVYAGDRTTFPEPLDEHAESMIRAEGPRLPEAISRVAIWEKPDGQRVPDREIPRVRCQ